MTTMNKSSTISDPSFNSSTTSSITTSGGSGQGSQRTIQVKIGNQAAKSMTPDQAADYLKNIAASSSSIFGSTSTSSSAAGGGGGGGSSNSGTFHREVKMTFENGSTSTVSLPRITASPPTGNYAGRKGPNTSALATAGFASTVSGSINNGSINKSLMPIRSSNSNINNIPSSALSSPGIGGGTRADGMPCSEKEMKALMSMFVEIMGLQMNTERLNEVSTPLGGSNNIASNNRKGSSSKQKQQQTVQESNPKKRSFSAVNTQLSTSAPSIVSDNEAAASISVDGAASNTKTSSKSLQASNLSFSKNRQQQQKKTLSTTSLHLQHGQPALRITATQHIASNGDVITATMTTALPANSTGMGLIGSNKDSNSLFQFPTDLPPPPGGWPEDLLWPDPKNAKNQKIVIRRSGNTGGFIETTNDLSDVDEDDDDIINYQTEQEGDTVVVITTTLGDSDDDEDDDADDYDDSIEDDDVEDEIEDDRDYDDNPYGSNDDDNDQYDTESDVVSIDSVPGLEPIPNSERPAFRLLQQKQRQELLNQQKILLAQQKRHEKLVLGGARYNSNLTIDDDDDDDITLCEEDDFVTGTVGIVPFEWGALERAAMEDALEQEERIRKETNKKRHDNNGSRGINRKGFRNYGGNHNNIQHHLSSGNMENYTSMNFGDHGPQGHTINAEYNSFQKKVDAANKKLGKAVQSWRNRVTAAAQSNDFAKLNTLLNGGAFPFSTVTGTSNTVTITTTGADSDTNNSVKPIHNKKSAKNHIEADKSSKSSVVAQVEELVSPEEDLSKEDRLVQQQFLHPHLEIIVPHCVPKQIRDGPALHKGKASRELLTTFILNQVGGLYFMVQPVLKAGASNTSILFGRSAFDTACFYGDVGVVKLIVAGLLKHFDNDMKAAASSLDKSDNDFAAVVPTASPNSLPYHSFLHQTCQDSGWTPLHYAAISGSIEVVELLLRCEYSTNYTTEATYENKAYQLLPLLYIESNDTLTWRKQSTNISGSAGVKNNHSGGCLPGRSGGITARQLVEFVKNGTIKKEIESHGMALEEIIDYYHLASNNTKTKLSDNNTTNFETQSYKAMLSIIYQRLLDCEMNGYHECTWTDEKVKKEIARALLPLELAATTASMASTTITNTKNEVGVHSTEEGRIPIKSPATVGGCKESASSVEISLPVQTTDAPTVTSSSASVATSNTNKQSGNKKKKNKKGQQPPPSSSTPQNIKAGTSQSNGASTSASCDDPVVSALLGMGFDRDQIMDGVKACGGLDRATADDVIAWIFGGIESNTPSTTVQSPPSSSNNVGNPSSQRKSVTEKESKGTDTQNMEKVCKPSNKSKKTLQEEERILAEQKLAAKREEQRRRNREWNNRAQARQIQEDMQKIAKAAVDANTGRPHNQLQHSATASNAGTAKGLVSGLPPLAPSTGLVGLPTGVTGGTVTPISILKRATTMTPPTNSGERGQKMDALSRNKSLGQANSHYAAVAAAGIGGSGQPNSYKTTNPSCIDLENVFSNDTSSATSSEFRCPPLMRSNIIEVTDNYDDATVSTIGSTPAIVVQQMPSTGASNISNHLGFLAPPGFANSKEFTSDEYYSNIPYSTRRDESVLAAHRPWDMDTNDKYGISDLNFSAPAYVPASTLYSTQRQVLTGSREAVSFVDLNNGSVVSASLTGLAPLGDGSYPGHGMSSLGLNTSQNGIEAGFLATAFGESNQTEANGVDYLLGSASRVDSANAGPHVPGLNIESFGLSDIGNNIDSSLIESISTGASALAWGNTSNNRQKSLGSSMLLGNVIGSVNHLDDQYANFGGSSYNPLNPFSNTIDAGSSRGIPVKTTDDVIGMSSLFQDHQGTLAAIGLVDDPGTVANSLGNWLGDEAVKLSDSSNRDADSKLVSLSTEIVPGHPSIW